MPLWGRGKEWQAAGSVGWAPQSTCAPTFAPTPQDMSSLMHTIYEVVDASVHHCSGSSKTLRVKLTVSPEPSSKRKDGPPAAQGESLGFWAPAAPRSGAPEALPYVWSLLQHPPPHAASPLSACSPCGVGGGVNCDPRAASPSRQRALWRPEHGEPGEGWSLFREGLGVRGLQ